MLGSKVRRCQKRGKGDQLLLAVRSRRGRLYFSVLICSITFLVVDLLTMTKSHGQRVRDSASSSHRSLATQLMSTTFETAVVKEVSTSSLTRSGRGLVWLYALVATDFNGSALIPHFLSHYRALGVQDNKMFLDLHHDPALPDVALSQCRDLLGATGVHTRLLVQEYTPELQDLAMLSALSLVPMHPEDWVIVVDLDEFLVFDGADDVYEVIDLMAAEQSTYAIGEMLDRVAPRGDLSQISNDTVIWDQFPLVCPVVSGVSKGLPFKVTIHKSYLRSGPGHHHIVEPYLAHAYFHECSGAACEIVMKQFKQHSSEDMYGITPYSLHVDEYATSATGKGWKAVQWSRGTRIHHFKWHASVLDNLQHRMSRDSGNCVLGMNEDTCQPMFQFWREVAQTMQALTNNRKIDVKTLDCRRQVKSLSLWQLS